MTTTSLCKEQLIYIYDGEVYGLFCRDREIGFTNVYLCARGLCNDGAVKDCNEVDGLLYRASDLGLRTFTVALEADTIMLTWETLHLSRCHVMMMMMMMRC